MMTRLRAVSVAACASVVAALLVSVPGAASAAGTTYYVSQGSGCSDAAAGTDPGAPLCTVTAAAKKAIAGDTVRVAAGTYHEQVTAVSGGVSYLGIGQPKVLGYDTVPGAAWTQASTNTWAAQPGWPTSPAQLYAGSTPLSRTLTAADVDTTADSWFWDSSTAPATLLVNTGSDPGSTIQGRWTYGFLVRGLGNITIDGFSLSGQRGAGVMLDGGTSSTTVRNVTVSQSGGYGVSDQGGTGNTVTGAHTTGNTSIGILLLNAQGDLVQSSTSDNNGFHGVSVQGGSNNTVRGVTAYANLKPGTRIATGIDVSSSSVGALVEQNTTYGNDDSGIEIYTGSTGAIVRDNLSYDNNDHGIDISKAPNSTVVSNTVVGNSTSGINVEGGSTDTVVRDNIAVDNTVILDRSKGDIRVDSASVPGTSIDRDLVFQTTATTTPIFEWNGVTYTSFSTFQSATGQEPTGMAQAPHFVSLTSRDLRLTGHSPAVDAADSAVPGWAGQDHTGVAPVDDPTAANRGTGPTTFADLGALEFDGAYALPPVASVASPDGLTVDVDASNSGTLGEPVSQMSIACGNGQVVQGDHGQCTYSDSGSYPVTVSVAGAVINGSSWTATATLPLGVQQDLPPSAVLSVSPDHVLSGGSVTADASGSSDDQPGATYDIDCGNGTPHAPASSTTQTCTYPDPGSYTVQLVVTDSAGQTATASSQVTVDAPPQAVLTLSSGTIKQGEQVLADGSGSTPGSAPVASYRIDCGNGTSPRTGTSPTRKCTYRSTGRFTVSLTTTDTLGHTSSASRTVRVLEGDPPTARLRLSRYRIHRHHAIVARAGASTGTAVSRITGYRFSCGNGHRTGWKKLARTRCYYARKGRFTVRVWVRSSLGLVDTTTRVVRVRR